MSSNGRNDLATQRKILALAAIANEYQQRLKTVQAQLTAMQNTYLAEHGNGTKFAISGVGAAVHVEKPGRKSTSYQGALEQVRTTHPDLSTEIDEAIDKNTKPATPVWSWSIEPMPLADQLAAATNGTRELIEEHLGSLAQLMLG